MSLKKKAINLIFQALIFLSIVSCSLFSDTNIEYAKVDVQKNDKVEIVNENYDYGPSSQILNDTQSINEEQVLGLVFSPAIYDSISYLGVLKALDEGGVKYSVVGSSGFSSLVTSLYLISSNNNLGFEWLAYKLKKSLNDKIYTSNWFDDVDEFIVDNFSKVKRSKIDKVLIYKLDSEESNKAVYSSTENLDTVLRQSIRPPFKPYKNKMVNFRNEIFSTKNLLKYGVDKILWIDIENTKPNLTTGNSYLIGTYNLLRTNIMNDKFSADFNMDLKSEFALDQVGNIGRKIKYGYSAAKRWIEENKDKLK